MIDWNEVVQRANQRIAALERERIAAHFEAKAREPLEQDSLHKFSDAHIYRVIAAEIRGL